MMIFDFDNCKLASNTIQDGAKMFNFIFRTKQ